MKKSLGVVRSASKRISGRAGNGSTLIEGTAGIVVVSLVVVPMLVFFANLAAHLLLQAKVAHIANQAALTVDDSKYWLGMPRPGFTETVASDKATNVARELCKRVGLKDASVNVTFETDNSDFEVTICDVNVNAVSQIPFRLNIFGFDMASLFPGNISARGVASHAKVQPYALIHMDAPHIVDEVNRRPLGFNQRDVAVIPAYGFFYNAVAGETTTPTEYGKGLAKNLSPENFFAMNHYHLKKSDVDYVLETGKDVQLSSWHPGRTINGQVVTFR